MLEQVLNSNFGMPGFDEGIMASYVHLQGVGKCAAKRAEEFEVGEVVRMNFDREYRVLGVLKTTEKTVTFQLESIEGEVKHKRMFYKDKLLALAKTYQPDSKLQSKSGEMSPKISGFDLQNMNFG